MQDREFFSNENVYVSLTRFIAFGQTYAMSGVTSVRAGEVKPSQAAALTMSGLGVLFFLLGFAASAGFFALGALLVICSVAVVNYGEPEYAVLLSISSGEVSALKSKDRELISNVVQALNDCIVARG